MRRPFLCGLALSLLPGLASGDISWQDGQLTVTAGAGPRARTLVRGLQYQASDQEGLALKTTRGVPGADGAVTFDLEGPAAGQATVSATLTPLPGGAALDWTIRYTGPPRQWNPYGCAFAFDFPEAITDLATRPVAKWVKPSGANPWEVKGDTVYPDTDCQLREVVFGDWALVMVAERYDADWIYGRKPERARFWAQMPPLAPQTEVRLRMALLVVSANDRDPARSAARAMGRPLALSVGAGRVGNLFQPGERVPLRLDVSNVTGKQCHGRLQITVHDYQGRTLLTERVPLTLAAGERRALRRSLQPLSRGVVFVDSTLSWVRGRQTNRATIGVLPERQATGPRPDSPFAMAAVIATPDLYPDHWDPDTVLGHMERIGVRWVRGGWMPFTNEPTPADEERARSQADLLRRHGLLPHTQLGITTLKPEDVPALKERLRVTLGKFGWVGPYVEVGNELNYSATGPEYVERVLRPASEVMREVFPQGKVVTMGLGGVMTEWFNGFVGAGGLELADVLSIHPGSYPKAPEFWEGWRGWVFRSQVQDALAAARQHGHKDVWITEAYAPTSPDRSMLDLRTAADYLVRTYVCAIALGVKVTEWYQFQDGTWYAQRQLPGDIEHNFGLVHVDLTPKPQYVAFGAMTEQLEGAACRGRLDLGAEDLYGVRFTREGKPVDVLWSYREKHETDIPWWPPERFAKDSRRPGEPWVERWRAPVTVSLPATGEVAVCDLMGNRRTLSPREGKATLELTGSPVYAQGLGDVPLRKVFWEELP